MMLHTRVKLEQVLCVCVCACVCVCVCGSIKTDFTPRESHMNIQSEETQVYHHWVGPTGWGQVYHNRGRGQVYHNTTYLLSVVYFCSLEKLIT